MPTIILALWAAFFLSAPARAIQPGQRPPVPAVKVDYQTIFDTVGVPEFDQSLYMRILGEAQDAILALPPGTNVSDTIERIVERERALILETDQDEFALLLTASLSVLNDQIVEQQERVQKPEPVPATEAAAQPGPTSPAPTTAVKDDPPPMPVTPADIRQGANQVLTTRFPKNRSGWTYTADDAIKKKDYRTAMSGYKKVIELGGGTPKVYTGYGSAAYHLGDLDKASEAAGQALEIDPSYAPAEALAALSKRNVRSTSPSSKTLASAAALMDNSGKALAAVMPSGGGVPPPARTGTPGSAPGPAAQSWTPPAAAGIAPEAVLKAEELVDAAASSLSLGDYVQGGDIASRAVGTDPLNSRAWTLRAVADSNLGKHKDAVYNASVALLLAPGNATALQMRSWSFNKTGRYKEALRDADLTLLQEPANPFHYYNRAYAQAGLADRPGATSSLKKASDLDDRFTKTYKAAVEAPEEADLVYLFDLMGPGTGDAVPAKPSRMPRPLLYGLAGGGVLLALASLVLLLRRRG
ncbi:MAG: tetratricopeptide repeat protein [Elusimicrobiota bacterium]|jgi:tetratricopeptide (TPR) repeat protein